MALLRIVRIVNALWCIVVFGYVAYGWYFYAGVYRVFAEWQMEVFGSYRVLLTALLPALALTLPSLLVAVWIQRTKGQVWAPTPNPHRDARILAALGAAGLVVAAGAGVLGYRAITHEPVIATFDLRQASAPPAADQFVVTGLARTDLMLGFETETRGSKRSYSYVPLTPPDWQRGQPLRHFLKTNQNAYLPPGGGRPLRLANAQPPFLMTTQRAVIESHTLPGPLREIYRNNNVPLADRLYIFSQNTSAAVEHHWIIVGIAGLGGIACLVAAGVTALRLRRNAG